jgi:hypothetical protein
MLQGAALTVLPALIFSTCAKLGTQAPTDVPRNDILVRAVDLVESGAFAEADSVLREVASACENGENGKRALMLLAALSLDPRNRDANPDSAALLAARYLFLPDIDPAERLVAESIYALALDFGASPTLRPARTSGPGRFALRFSDCSSAPASLSDPLTPLPMLGRESRATSLRVLLAERDSLLARISQSEEEAALAGRRSKDLEDELRRVQAELQTAQAELQRIRRLLGAPDTTRSEPRR